MFAGRMRSHRRVRLCCYDKSGDQAGSDAKPGVGTRCSLRPEISTVNKDGPPLPPGSRKNITTRPFGAKVGPSLWKPEVRMRSPEPSAFMMPFANCQPHCLVKAMKSPRRDQDGVEVPSPYNEM